MNECWDRSIFQQWFGWKVMLVQLHNLLKIRWILDIRYSSKTPFTIAIYWHKTHDRPTCSWRRKHPDRRMNKIMFYRCDIKLVVNIACFITIHIFARAKPTLYAAKQCWQNATTLIELLFYVVQYFSRSSNYCIDCDIVAKIELLVFGRRRDWHSTVTHLSVRLRVTPG